MKKYRKFEDAPDKESSKRTGKKVTGSKKRKGLNPKESRPPKYKHSFLTEEE